MKTARMGFGQMVTRRPQPREDAIRTLGVSLVAIAAIAASLTLVRQRAEARQSEPRPVPEEPPATADPNLEAIRSAGL